MKPASWGYIGESVGLFFVGGSELARILNPLLLGSFGNLLTPCLVLWDPQWDPGELFSFPGREPFPELPLPQQLEVCGMSAALGLHEGFVTWL